MESNKEISYLKEKIIFLETIIEELKNLDLYESTLEYDYEEMPYEIYSLFDIDEFIEDIKYQKQLIK